MANAAAKAEARAAKKAAAPREEAVVKSNAMPAMSMAAAVASNLWGGVMNAQQTLPPAAAKALAASSAGKDNDDAPTSSAASISGASSTSGDPASPPSASPPPTSPPASPPEEPTPEQSVKPTVMPGAPADLSSVHDLYPARLFRVKAPKPIDILYSILVAATAAWVLDRMISCTVSSPLDHAIDLDPSSSNDTAFDTAFEAAMALPGRRLQETVQPPPGTGHAFEGYTSPWSMAFAPAPILLMSAAVCPGAPVDWSLPSIIFHALGAASIAGRARFTYTYFNQICDYAARNGIDDRILLTWQLSLVLVYATALVRFLVSFCSNGKLYWPAMRVMLIANAVIMMSVLAVLTWLDAPYTAPPLCISRMGGLVIAAAQIIMSASLGPALRYRIAQAVGITRARHRARTTAMATRGLGEYARSALSWPTTRIAEGPMGAVEVM